MEPVKCGVEAGVRLGLGKQEQENFYMDADNVYWKKLEVELQAEEDQDRRDKREVCQAYCTSHQQLLHVCLNGGVKYRTSTMHTKLRKAQVLSSSNSND